jgi:hypothetical protein
VDETVRFRPGWRQLQWWIVPFAAAQLLLYRGDRTRGVVLAFAAVYAVLIACVIVAHRFLMGVDLRPDAIVLCGLRRRAFPWSEVHSVHRATMLGTHVVYVGARGRSWMLRAPTHQRFLAPDPDFDAKFATIVRYWNLYG